MNIQEAIQRPYNSRIIDIYMKLIKKRYAHVDVEELLKYAEMEPYQVADQGHWFSQDQVDAFYEKLVELSGNQFIAREAGQFAAGLQDSNLMSRYFLTMIGPATAYDVVGKVSSNFTRSEQYKARKLSSSSVEITVSPIKGSQEKPYQCENRTGLLEAISMLYNKTLPRVEHPECIFKGDESCKYVISWERSRAAVLKTVRNILAPILVVISAVAYFTLPLNPFLITAGLSAAGVLGFSLFSKTRESIELATHLNEVQSSTDELIRQININYNNTLITHEIGQVVNQQSTLNGILESVIHISEKRLEFDRGLILLANDEKDLLEFRSGFGYIQEHLDLLKNTAFHLDRLDSRGVFVISFREKKPFLVNDINSIKKDLSPRSLEFAKELGSKAFICCPIICDNEPLGILTADNNRSQRPLVQTDMSLLLSIASVIGIAIKNAKLTESREKQFQSILKALASSIDARDPLTSGHSEKVTQYALGICKGMNLSREFKEVIKIAALLHDYGKIGVPDRILKKSGRLTEREFSIIKTHVEKTKEILDQISFEGMYLGVPEIAGAHHERYDGQGYPAGLKGEDIPLGARIIAVADFYEAITAQRHYRNPMTRSNAIKTLKKERGDHLDSQIVDIFLEYLDKNDIF